jgi:hypothetical protein
LRDDTSTRTSGNTCDVDRPLLHEEILEYAMQHDLPVFVSIDRSLDNDNATVSISIVAPDIRCIDMSAEWQGRPAKVSLI